MAGLKQRYCRRHMKLSQLTHCIVGLTLGCLATVAQAGEVGALFTTDNAAAANHVLAYGRAENGQLTSLGSTATGGNGTGSTPGLPSQGAVLLSQDGRWLFVCNAGSDDISVLSVSHHGLTVTDKVSSGGRRPLSLALHHNLLYVLNAGGLVGDKDNISGFVFAHGQLTPLADSTRALSADNTGPAQVAFAREGHALVVTERASNVIDTFTVGNDGLATNYQAFQSVGATPFGFDVGRGNRVFVSEAAGGAANASSASAYQISNMGDLAVLSGAVPTEQTAACWLLTSRNGRYVYTANAGSGSLSSFRVHADGTLHLAESQAGLTRCCTSPTSSAWRPRPRTSCWTRACG